jgi:pilus assembly protein TadC
MEDLLMERICCASIREIVAISSSSSDLCIPIPVLKAREFIKGRQGRADHELHEVVDQMKRQGDEDGGRLFLRIG